MNVLEQISASVINGDAAGTVQLTRQALDAGLSADEILNEGLIAGLSEVGRRMESKTFFIPEVLVAARAMKAAEDVLKPVLVSNCVKPTGRVVLATVEGDVHDIGKNLVKLMLECAGFEVTDLGVNVPAASIIRAVSETRPNIIGLSALLTTTVVRMKEVIEDLKRNDLRSQVKIIVGGAAVTRDYAEQIGADAYSPDCTDAAKRAKELVQTN